MMVICKLPWKDNLSITTDLLLQCEADHLMALAACDRSRLHSTLCAWCTYSAAPLLATLLYEPFLRFSILSVFIAYITNSVVSPVALLLITSPVCGCHLVNFPCFDFNHICLIDSRHCFIKLHFAAFTHKYSVCVYTLSRQPAIFVFQLPSIFLPNILFLLASSLGCLTFSPCGWNQQLSYFRLANLESHGKPTKMKGWMEKKLLH